MFNIFDAFRGTPTPAPQGATPAGGANQGAPTGATPNGAAPNGMIPPQQPGNPGPTNTVTPGTAPGAAPNGNPGGAPVDDWVKMWENGNSAATKANESTSLFDIKPEQIQAAAKQMKFASNLNPELVTKALQGDANSFMEVLDAVAQSVYAQASYSSMRLADAGINKYGKQFRETELPKHFQDFTATHALRNANTVFADPKYAPMLDTFKRALLTTNPQASPQEIQATAERYLKSMIDDAGKTQSAPSGPASPGNQENKLVTGDGKGNDDWSAYFQPAPQFFGPTQ